MKSTTTAEVKQHPVNWKLKKEVLFLVYGTLKQKEGNNRVLGESEYLGNFTTKPEYILYDGGFPFVERGGNTAIQCEIFKATTPRDIASVFQLEGCSGIQGHETNWYDFDICDTPYGEAIIFCANKGVSGRTHKIESGLWLGRGNR